MDVIVILRHDVDSWNSLAPTFMVVASDKTAAKRWIQDEVDGKHSTNHSYMQGKDADWWIRYGTFSIRPATIHT